MVKYIIPKKILQLLNVIPFSKNFLNIKIITKKWSISIILEGLKILYTCNYKHLTLKIIFISSGNSCRIKPNSRPDDWILEQTFNGTECWGNDVGQQSRTSDKTWTPRGSGNAALYQRKRCLGTWSWDWVMTSFWQLYYTQHHLFYTCATTTLWLCAILCT